jgi:predicted transglutaminase-like cysteine proteinase
MPEVKRTTRIIKRKASVYDAVSLIKQTAREHKNSAAVSRILSLYPFSRSMDWFKTVHNYLSAQIKYRYDEAGREQIKTPDRFLLKDGFGDCDDFSTLWAAILNRLGILHHIKIVKYQPGGNWAHVYVIVPRKGGKYLVLDNVAHLFGKEPFEEVQHVESEKF